MKEYNFNKFNELTTPESWVEKALAIPEAEEKRRSAAKSRLIRYAAVAAAFVLIGAVTVTLFANKISEPPVIVKPTTVQSATETAAPTVEKPTVEKPTAASSSPTAPTEKATRPASTAPTQAGAQTPQAAPVTANSPTVKPTSAPAQPATKKPTSTPAPQPTEPAPAPTQPPTVPPATVPGDKPTEIAPVGYDGIIIEKISADEVGDDSIIYCRIRTSDGTIIGDGDPYSEQHCARRIDRDGTVMMYYVPYDCVTLPYAGMYRFEFYDETGKILYTGDEYLMPEIIN